ncbi:MAG TPA: pitrilysin family protein [Croceibacterium sp.]|nr:pitrilysin family protein [Croceibacterium sp.]
MRGVLPFVGFLASALLPLPALAQPAAPVPVSQLVAEVDIPYQSFTLANGLRVLVHTDRKAPIVAVSTWYDVGSKHEPEGKTGFAHLFEHLMFQGSENAPGDFFAPLRDVGATDFNGTTNFDRTNYFETVPKPALERALFLESDRMGYLLGAIDQALLDEQRGVVQNEKRQGDNRPYGLVFYELLEQLLAGTPYGHNVIGSMADLDAASLDDVKTWFRQHYGPNNTVLVLAGDIDAAEARPLVEKYFGAIGAGPRTQAPVVEIPTLAEPKTVIMHDRIAAPLVIRSWAVPGMNDPDAVPLDVFGAVLGGLASSRLTNALVREEKLAVQVSAGTQSMSQLGIFVIQAVVRPGVDPAAVGTRIDEIMADLLASGPTADEVQRYVTSSVSSRIAGLEAVGGFGGKAVALASGEIYANDPEFYKKQLGALASTTPQQVQAAARKWLTRPALTIAVVPGEREAYEESQSLASAATAAPAPARPAPAAGTRGALPQVAGVDDLDFPEVTRSRLSNGIELVYAHRDAVPVTRVLMSFDAGAAADPDGKLGTQSLTLSLLREGTTSKTSTQIAEAGERLGASLGTGASADRTYLTVASPSPNLEGALDLFADVVRNPAFAPAEVERLRASLLTSIAAELVDPASLANRAMPKLVFGPDHPYAKLAAGSGDPGAVRALTRDELVAFHRAWIRPDKAKIFVVSDLPLEQVRAALDARFGSWRGEGPAGAKAFTAAPQPSAPKVLLIDRPNSPQSIILAGQMTALDPQSELLVHQTGNQVLGSGFLSRINMELRENRHWSYGSSGGFNWLEHAVAYGVNAPVQADRTGDSIKAIQEQVGQFLTTNGVTPAELTREINGTTRELAGRYETSSAVLGAMLQNDVWHRPDDFYDTVAQTYRAMTAAQLDAAMRSTLDPGKFVWVVVGDAATVRPQLDAIGLPVEVVPAEALAPPAAAGN